MTFRQRLPYFLGGLGIGILVVIFFLGKKNTTFDYGPNSRVLKNIRVKNPIYSDKALEILNSNRIDTSQVAIILKSGNVDIWNKIKSDSCITYNIKGRKDLNHIILTVNNCATEAIIESIIID
jgi:hypothetical protein